MTIRQESSDRMVGKNIILSAYRSLRLQCKLTFLYLKYLSSFKFTGDILDIRMLDLHSVVSISTKGHHSNTASCLIVIPAIIYWLISHYPWTARHVQV